MRRGARRDNVGSQLSLKHRRASAPGRHPGLQGRDVGDERPAESCRERRREVTRLVGVRKEDEIWRFLTDESRQREDMTIRCVRRQRGVIDMNHFVDACRCQFGRDGSDTGSENGDLDWPRALLRSRDRFPRGAVEGAVTLFCYDEES